MPGDADRFRARAAECRELAQSATNPEVRDMLVRLASELQEEADKIDSDQPEQRLNPPLRS